MRNDIFLKEMGQKIRAIRKLRQVGEQCQLDFGAVSRIELGEKDSHILTLKRIADVLKVDVKDFI
jgi:transcriptional regulator with XRE-family HTH domain